MDYLIDPFRTMYQWAGIAYSAYPGAFHGAGIALTVVFLYFAVIEIAARVAK